MFINLKSAFKGVLFAAVVIMPLSVAISPVVDSQPLPVTTAIPLTKADKTCLKQAVYHEARGEPIEGKVLVATVVLNRYQSNRYPNSVCGVVYQPKQFSHIEQAVFPRTFPTSVVQAVDIALGQVQITLTLPDNLQALSHFHSGRPPFWATEDTFVAKVGGHSFHALH